MKVLFICKANVGRSQMGEVILKQVAGEKYHVSSAGTVLKDQGGNDILEQKLKDYPGSKNTIESLKEIGIDASSQIRRQLIPDMVTEADKIISMAQSETLPEYLIKSKKVSYWDVPDAKGTGLEFHRKVRNQIKELVIKLVNES